MQLVGLGERAHDVVHGESLVEIDGCGVALDQVGHRLGEPR